MSGETPSALHAADWKEYLKSENNYKLKNDINLCPNEIQIPWSPASVGQGITLNGNYCTIYNFISIINGI